MSTTHSLYSVVRYTCFSCANLFQGIRTISSSVSRCSGFHALIPVLFHDTCAGFISSFTGFSRTSSSSISRYTGFSRTDSYFIS